MGCADGATRLHAGTEFAALMAISKNTSKTIRPVLNLALQGGGSHGAFTWGVLDALLEDGRVELEGLSGTSAGAMNAVALAHGFSQAMGKTKADAREAARESLANFWNGIVDMGGHVRSAACAVRPALWRFGG